MHQLTRANHSSFVGLVALLDDEGDADDDGDGAEGADDVDLFAVAEDADEEAHDDGGEGESSDDAHVLGEDEGADVAELADGHGNAREEDAFEEVLHVHLRVASLTFRKRVQNHPREEDEYSLDEVDLDRVHALKLLGQHHSVAVDHHEQDHADTRNGHDHRILRLVALKLALVDIVILVDVTDQVRAIGSNRHAHDGNHQEDNLRPVDGHPVEVVVVDVDEDGGNAVESDRHGKRQVELGKGIAEVVQHHDRVPRQQPLVVVRRLEGQVQLEVARHAEADDRHCHAPYNACLHRMELMLVAVDVPARVGARTNHHQNHRQGLIIASPALLPLGALQHC